MSRDTYILAALRTPIGSFGGVLSPLGATRLGAQVVKAVADKVGLKPGQVDELIMGNVVSSGLGQAPATQVAIHAGLGPNIPCTLVNKVCASGMKAVMFASQSVSGGAAKVVIAGGMESMTNIPYYLMKARQGYKYGNGELVDGLQYDGLTDAYDHCAMGVCADNTAKEMKISRQQQDEYAVMSYRRAAEAWSSGLFADEVIPVEIENKKGAATVVKEDEEFRKVNFDRVPTLRAVFSPDGTVTAANASSINDGACALVVASREAADELGVKPIARILGFADAAQDPRWFTTTPSLAIPRAMEIAGVKPSDVSYYEINEAFAAVALANNIKLGLDPAYVNVHGGAVALGHPLGASGARILTTLINVLKRRNATIGVAGICNGGGGASAIVIERM